MKSFENHNLYFLVSCTFSTVNLLSCIICVSEKKPAERRAFADYEYKRRRIEGVTGKKKQKDEEEGSRKTSQRSKSHTFPNSNDKKNYFILKKNIHLLLFFCFAIGRSSNDSRKDDREARKTKQNHAEGKDAGKARKATEKRK